VGTQCLWTLSFAFQTSRGDLTKNLTGILHLPPPS
jgi:hypothetical protein